MFDKNSCNQIYYLMKDHSGFIACFGFTVSHNNSLFLFLRRDEGKRWVLFFQDTNGLLFNVRFVLL